MSSLGTVTFKLACQLRLLREIIYPRRCAVCKEEIADGCFCPRCRSHFSLRKKISGPAELPDIIVLYKYQEQLTAILRQIKFARARSLLPLLAEEAALALPSELACFTDAFDSITAIPTSAERRQQRGFDIPEAIFAPLFTAKWQGKLLARTRRTAPLYGLPPALRRLEISKCFAVRHSVAGQRILLCDDIYTSGSTLQEAARTLLAAGAAQVTGLAFSASRDNW